MRTGNPDWRPRFLCDRCANSKPRKEYGECWCRNKVVQKIVVFDDPAAAPLDACAYFTAKGLMR